MRRRMMKSKIHRATVTGANLHYVGSVSIDTELLALADILPYEQVAVLDIDNGARFETYAIEGERAAALFDQTAAAGNFSGTVDDIVGGRVVGD